MNRAPTVCMHPGFCAPRACSHVILTHRKEVGPGSCMYRGKQRLMGRNFPNHTARRSQSQHPARPAWPPSPDAFFHKLGAW